MTTIVTAEEIIALRNTSLSQQSVVLATGVFDILHAEHRRFLKRAKSEGNVFIVGIEPDVRVRALKGQDRPINRQPKRLQNLASENIADYVFILPDNLGTRAGREAFIQKLKPQIYAVSSHTSFQEEKRRIMEKFKGQLKVVHPHNPQLSTTQIIAAKNTKYRRG